MMSYICLALNEKYAYKVKKHHINRVVFKSASHSFLSVKEIIFSHALAKFQDLVIFEE